ncbi:MAG: PAS domain-containing hybrid sensor histidine kinase/response regulator [Syntrophales bacterium]
MKDDNQSTKQFANEFTEWRSQNGALKESTIGSLSAGLDVEEARRYAESIVETIREPLLVLDANLKIISANRNFYRTFKVAPGETIGSYIYDLGNRQWDIPMLRKLLEEVLPEKEAFDDFEVDHNFRDIGHRIMLLNARQIRRKESGAKMILLAIEEITERRRLESVLKDSEERFRRLFETASDGILLLEKSEGRIMQANPATEKILGYTSKECVGNKLQDIGIVLDDGKFQTTMQNLNENDILNFVDFPIKTKSGQHIDTDIYLVDRAMLAQCNIRDITLRKQAEMEKRGLEEQLRRAEKMEALGQLAGGVAHDLNNVLGVLSGYSELLLLEISEGERARGYVKKILESTEKGAAIIQDLLTLARRGVPVCDVISLNSVIADFFDTPMFEKMKGLYPRVLFRTECDGNILNIKGSLVHLEKTLMNLALNAAESISGAGVVTIRTQSRYLDRAVNGYHMIREGDYTVLSVSDTGAGIPVEDRQKIFEPFYTKKKMGQSGTGLGLAIVWGTVTDHNGYIDIQTEVGEGTTFTLYFPSTREELIAPQQKTQMELYMGNGESALVVDDVPEQRGIASVLLTRLGYHVNIASSGEEAVEYLKGHKADFLVLDMIMPPGIDGLETYRRIRQISPSQKAILVSGFSETERVREAQRLGAGAYVKKPYLMEKIGMAIRAELNRQPVPYE